MLDSHDRDAEAPYLVSCCSGAPHEVVCSLTRLLDELPIQDRLLLSLRYTDCLADAETAEVLRVPSHRVAEARAGAEKRLRAALAASYPTLSGESHPWP